MPKMKISEVSDRALICVKEILARWAPGGTYQGSEYIALNPTRCDQSKGSFSINWQTGKWSEFADGTVGGDLVSLIAYLEGVSQSEACNILIEFLGIATLKSFERAEAPTVGRGRREKKVWRVITPVPVSAYESCPAEHYKNGKPSAIWEYRGPDHRLLFKLFRFDSNVKGEIKKDYRPLTYCSDGHGAFSWRWQQIPDNRPLYGLDRLSEAPRDAMIVLCEGEKAADAAQELLPQVVAMSWPGGSKAIRKVDFSPLAGRSVCFWPDNDDAGRDCMTNLDRLIKKTVSSSSFVNLNLFGNCWPPKADAADVKVRGIKADEILRWINDGSFFISSEPTIPVTNQFSASEDCVTKTGKEFVLNDKGVFYRAFDENQEGTLFRVCDRLEVIARTRDDKGANWGILVRFSDPDGKAKDWNIPNELLATEGGAEVLRQLYSLGLNAEPGQQPRRRLIQYLQTANTQKRSVLVSRLGWHSEAYLLPSTTIGSPKEPLYFYSPTQDLNKIDQAGSIEEWQKNVSRYAQGNPWVIFCISAGFAAPLLNIIGLETSGFHFYGSSSQGKSALVKIAASVYGPPDYRKTWRSTDNALESIAAAHSDGLLILDEIGQCDPRIVGDITYMLGNGKGKSRANERGVMRGATHEWRLVVLSTGEQTLQQHMAEAGKSAKAGQDIRLISIPSDAGSGMGIYNCLHDFSGGAALSDYLVDMASKYYGYPIIEFIEQLCGSDREKIARHIQKEILEFCAELPENASGQVYRTAKKFAVIGIAGELAAKAGITGWDQGDSKAASRKCFDAWISDRGGAGNMEDSSALSQIKILFEKYGESRFTRWDGDGSTVDLHGIRTMERWGYRREVPIQDENTETWFYVFPESFKQEVCKGLNLKQVKLLLADLGALAKDSQGSYTMSKRLPGGGSRPQRVYLLKPHLIGVSIEE